MATYDIVMLLIILFMAFRGWQKGMAWQLASLASLVLSGSVARMFGEQLAPHIGFESWALQYGAALVILFLGTSLAIWMIFRVVRSSIEQMKLNDFDRHMGAMLGGIIGAGIVCIVTFLAVGLTGDGRTIMSSRSGHFAHELFHVARPLLPETAVRWVVEYMDTVDGQMHELDPNLAQDHATPPAYPGQPPQYGNQPYGGQPGYTPSPGYSQPPSYPNYPSQTPGYGAQPQPYTPPSPTYQPPGNWATPSAPNPPRY